MATSGSQLTRSGPAAEEGESQHQGEHKHHTWAHYTWWCVNHLERCQLGISFYPPLLDRVFNKSVTNHPDGQAVCTWLSSCVQMPCARCGQTADRMHHGEGAAWGMQQMTAMQILEINHVTGSVLCFEGASWMMQILRCKYLRQEPSLWISVFMIPLLNAPNPILMGYNSTQMTSLSGSWIQSPLELI